MEMKRNLLLLIGLCMAVCVQAQKKNFSYKFYGQVRGDLFYNSRANAESWMVCSTYIRRTWRWMRMART